MKIAVIGLGLIGGSFAKSLKALRPDIHFIGSDRSSQNEERALELQLVDTCMPLNQAIETAEIILLAIPVDAIATNLPEILSQIREDQLVIDFGSTKAKIVNSVAGHPRRSNFLAAHPMAGTEHTGPDAAFTGLFRDKVLILCDTEETSPELLQKAQALFDLLSFQVITMESEAHDKHIAYVSHLSHVSSFMLGLTVLDIEKDEANIFNMAGSGFQSTVRLAMSSPAMWAPIFIQNKDNVQEALSQYISQLQTFQEALLREDTDKLLDLMTDANRIRKPLDKKRS